MKNKTAFSGILLIDKPAGITSHDVVFKVRKLYGTREVGHTGTLDPMATGLLVVLVGRAVKASELIVSDSKRYVAGLTLGITTDTEDVTGEVLTRSDRIPTEAEVKAVAETFVGEGKVVEREARPITVHSLSALRENDTHYTLDVFCSKGTYIRTLCADIGSALSVGGAMHSLRRVASGAFSLDSAYTLEALGKMSEEERIAILRPVEEVFSELPVLKLPAFYEKLLKNGCEIYQSKIGTSYPEGKRLRLVDQGGFYALAEVRSYPDGLAIKAIKRFDVN